MANTDVKVKLSLQDDLSKGLKGVGNNINSFGKNIANVGMNMLKVGTLATGALITGLTVAGKKAVEMASTFEQSEIAFTTLLKDRTRAISALKEIEEDAKKTPYNLPDLIKANQLLISAGVNTEDARKQIINLGNAISATGGGTDELNRLSVNLQQIKALGKATALDIRQFAFAGINIYKLLSETTGKTVEEVREMDVSYELLTESLARASAEGGMFAGAMENQAKSFQGIMSNLKDVIGLTLKDIAMDTGLFDAVKNGAQSLLTWVTENKDEFTNFFKTLGGYIMNVGGVVSNLVTTFQGWWDKMKEIWDGYIKPILLPLIYEVQSAFYEVLQQLQWNSEEAKGLGYILKGFLFVAITAIVTALWLLLEILKIVLKIVAEGIELFRKFSGWVGSLSGKFYEWKESIEEVIEVLKTLWDYIKKIGWEKIEGVGEKLGFKAVGGLVTPSKSYIVGERGAELFTPPTTGKIVPAGQFGGSGSNVSLNVNVGIYAGTETEKRNIAESLYKGLVQLAQMQNKTVAQLLGA